MRRQPIIIWGVLSFACFCPVGAWGASSTSIPSLDITTAQASAFIKTIGICMDNRAYLPASTLSGYAGLDLGIEATLAQPPSDLGTALGTLMSASSGSTSSSATAVPFIPSIKFGIHKSFGERFELGGSILPTVSTIPYIGGTMLVGGDAKFVVFKPEEGLTWALRFSYNYNSLVVSQSSLALTLKTHTITPSLIVSRKLNFAEPYMGLGFQYTWGIMGATVTIPQGSLPVALAPITIEQVGNGSSPYFFLGLAMRIPAVGFKITMEGSYNPGGINTLGAKIGFDF